MTGESERRFGAELPSDSSDESLIARRNFLKKTLAGAIGAEFLNEASSPANEREVVPDNNEANRERTTQKFLETFSPGKEKNLPGVEKIEHGVIPQKPFGIILYIEQVHDELGRSMTSREYEHPDFKEIEQTLATKRKLLKFLGQPDDYLPKDIATVKRNLEEMKEVQQNIYIVVFNLMKKFGVREVYPEGIAADTQTVEQLWQEQKDLREKIVQENDEGKRSKLREEARRLEATITSGTLGLVSLSRSGRIKISPTESKEINSQAIKALKEGDEQKFQEFALKKREDFAIASSTKGKPVIAPLIFGRAHKKGFIRAVEEYNEKHPREPYALVILTPRGYPQK